MGQKVTACPRTLRPVPGGGFPECPAPLNSTPLNCWILYCFKKYFKTFYFYLFKGKSFKNVTKVRLLNKILQPNIKHQQFKMFLKMLNIELPFDPEIPLLGIYPEEGKAGMRADTCTFVFSSIIHHSHKEATWVSMDRCKDKQNMVYINTYSGLYSSTIKRKEILTQATIWMNMLYGKKKTPNTINHM